MEIWITRAQDRGILLESYAPPDEIEEGLKGLQVYDELSFGEDVKVEFSGSWGDIKSFFQDIQLLADYVRGSDFAKDSEQDKLIMRMCKRKLIRV